MKIRGYVEAYVDGRKVAEFCNTTLYSGYDMEAKALSGDTDYVINGMYLQFKNVAPTLPVIPLTRKPTYYAALTGTDGYVRVKTFSEPEFSTTDATKYDFNKATFIATSSSTSSAGAAVIDGTSQFYSVALVAIPDINDQTKDILFSASAIKSSLGVFAPITKIANSQVSFKWSIKCEA